MVFENGAPTALEITEEASNLMRRSCSIQAENRLHAVKAVMVWTLRLLMRIVVALGGNSCSSVGTSRTSETQEHHIDASGRPQWRRSAHEHEVVMTHGNGPQVGLLALESGADRAPSHAYPLDSLGAQTQGHDRLFARSGLRER